MNPAKRLQRETEGTHTFGYMTQQPQLRYIRPFHFTSLREADLITSSTCVLNFDEVRIDKNLEIKRIQTVSVPLQRATDFPHYYILLLFYWIAPRGHCRGVRSERNIFSERIVLRQVQRTTCDDETLLQGYSCHFSHNQTVSVPKDIKMLPSFISNMWVFTVCWFLLDLR